MKGSAQTASLRLLRVHQSTSTGCIRCREFKKKTQKISESEVKTVTLMRVLLLLLLAGTTVMGQSGADESDGSPGHLDSDAAEHCATFHNVRTLMGMGITTEAGVKQHADTTSARAEMTPTRGPDGVPPGWALLSAALAHEYIGVAVDFRQEQALRIAVPDLGTALFASALRELYNEDTEIVRAASGVAYEALCELIGEAGNGEADDLHGALATEGLVLRGRLELALQNEELQRQGRVRVGLAAARSAARAREFVVEDEAEADSAAATDRAISNSLSRAQHSSRVAILRTSVREGAILHNEAEQQVRRQERRPQELQEQRQQFNTLVAAAESARDMSAAMPTRFPAQKKKKKKKKKRKRGGRST